MVYFKYKSKKQNKRCKEDRESRLKQEETGISFQSTLYVSVKEIKKNQFLEVENEQEENSIKTLISKSITVGVS